MKNKFLLLSVCTTLALVNLSAAQAQTGTSAHVTYTEPVWHAPDYYQPAYYQPVVVAAPFQSPVAMQPTVDSNPVYEIVPTQNIVQPQQHNAILSHSLADHPVMPVSSSMTRMSSTPAFPVQRPICLSGG